MSRRIAVGVLLTVVIGSAGARPGWAVEDDEPILGQTLSTVFNPRSAPAQKTMGLLQRSFLDLVEESQPRLQIALVFDGTESMGDQLESVRQSLTAMMNDLELYKERNITYQVIVFRDAGSPSGMVELPLQTQQNQFVADRDAVLQAINDVKPESGAPYYPELIDEGVNAALTKLAWSLDEETSRWILLFGDAPPFEESFDEPANQASRRVGTDALVSLATAKGVRINCILCTSRPEDRDAYEKTLPQTRQFMNTLSSKTGGLMLDLSYDDIRAAVRKSAAPRRVEYQQIGVIRQEDVEQARRAAEQTGAIFSEGRRVRIAVLPHLPLASMSFDSSSEAAQLAAELRLRLRSLPGIEFKDPATTRDRFETLARQGLQGDELLMMLARALGVDYVMWGTIDRAGGPVVATTAIYDRTAARRVVQALASTNPTVKSEELGALLADKLVAAPIDAPADLRMKSIFASVMGNESKRSALMQPVALDAARSPLLEGLDALEQALAYPVGQPEAEDLLKTAQASLTKAAELDDENPTPRFLLANCLYNQARALVEAGDQTSARAVMKPCAQRLSEAFQRRTKQADDAASRTEIEADYALIIRANVPDAIKLYRKLLDESAGVEMQSARRAYWMLAGIYSGDWGVDQKFVDREEAKRCLTQILAIWPDSSEAEFIRRALRWDEAQGGARFQHFPKENGELTAEVDRGA